MAAAVQQVPNPDNLFGKIDANLDLSLTSFDAPGLPSPVSTPRHSRPVEKMDEYPLDGPPTPDRSPRPHQRHSPQIPPQVDEEVQMTTSPDNDYYPQQQQQHAQMPTTAAQEEEMLPRRSEDWRTAQQAWFAEPSTSPSGPRPSQSITAETQLRPSPPPEWAAEQWGISRRPSQQQAETWGTVPVQEQARREPSRTRERERERTRERNEVRVSGSARVQAQVPTLTMAVVPPAPAQAAQPQVEEVCVECAMRDQDMADVDVTSPGIWTRESDIAYEDLLAREIAEEDAGLPPPASDDPRPRARGGRLTEANLKLWLTLNPKESNSKRMNLDIYVRSQLALLEAEALARARAQQDARRAADRARDTFAAAQRRSTADLAHSYQNAHHKGLVTPEHDGVKLGDGATLLENGLIVEHVDVRREAREKRRAEKRGRSRKSSRGSVADVASVYSLGNPLSGYPYDPSQQHAPSPSSRPMSVLTAPALGGENGSMMSVGSIGVMGNESPRRRFFGGMRNLSQGFRSNDSLAQSGSMIDMHVALQRENNRLTHNGLVPERPSSLWHEYAYEPQPSQPISALPAPAPSSPPGDEKKKKKKGLAKLWGRFTGSSAKSPTRDVVSGPPQQTRGFRSEDEPLEPPPPLSYLVGQRRSGHASTPSLPSGSFQPPGGMSMSPSTGPMSISQSGMSITNSAGPGLSVSPPSAPSSALPSPTSARLEPMYATHVRKASGAGMGMEGEHSYNGYAPAQPLIAEEGVSPPPLRATGPQLAHMTSEPDMRQRLSQHMENAPPVPRIPATLSQTGRVGSSGSVSSWRDKSLPPLPGEMGVRGVGEQRPRTLFGMHSMPSDEQGLQPPEPGFRSQSNRRQSFSGIGAGEALHPNMRASTLLTPVQPPAKRKSKFLGALLGRGRRDSTVSPQEHRSSGSDGSVRAASAYGNAPMSPVTPHGAYATHGYAASQGYAPSQGGYTASHAGYAQSQAGYAPSVNGYAASQSGYGSVSGYGGSQAHAQVAHPRRSNIDALVEQAPDFVAYRYPSAAEPMR
ncbi:hypothetical protein PENSPDRAFT_649040 [Peniophora sp. CONT]|nr:hypothetical protein PENSPDRAFT_649040 [Peniophora sp. CONT]